MLSIMQFRSPMSVIAPDLPGAWVIAPDLPGA